MVTGPSLPQSPAQAGAACAGDEDHVRQQAKATRTIDARMQPIQRRYRGPAKIVNADLRELDRSGRRYRPPAMRLDDYGVGVEVVGLGVVCGVGEELSVPFGVCVGVGVAASSTLSDKPLKAVSPEAKSNTPTVNV